jgi:hypothetical protein
MKRHFKGDQPQTHKHMVKKRHTRAYNIANKLLIKQAKQQANHNGACLCGSNMVSGFGGNGKIELFCTDCHQLLYIKDMSHERFGDKMTDIQKQNLRSGYCEFCGHDFFYGVMYVTSPGKYVYDYQCARCHHQYVLKDEQKNDKHKGKRTMYHEFDEKF